VLQPVCPALLGASLWFPALRDVRSAPLVAIPKPVVRRVRTVTPGHLQRREQRNARHVRMGSMRQEVERRYATNAPVALGCLLTDLPAVHALLAAIPPLALLMNLSPFLLLRTRLILAWIARMASTLPLALLSVLPAPLAPTWIVPCVLFVWSACRVRILQLVRPPAPSARMVPTLLRQLRQPAPCAPRDTGWRRIGRHASCARQDAAPGLEPRMKP
jgi:hypothetical protein